jgi:hypothetical protein
MRRPAAGPPRRALQPAPAAAPSQLGVWLAAEAATFLLAALLHLGVRLGPLAEPPSMPAASVESLAGLGLAIAVAALLMRLRSAWPWRTAVAAQAFALLGVLLGITASALGPGPHSGLNDVYHRVMLLALLASLAFTLRDRRRLEHAPV